MIPFAASFDIPDPLLLGIVATMFLAAGGFLLAFQSIRKAAVKEIKMEARAGEEPSKVQVQSPLSIKAHVECTPMTEHEALKVEFEKLREQRRQDVSGLHTKIEKGIEGVRKDVANEIRDVGKAISATREELIKNTTKTETAAAAVTVLSGKVDTVLREMPRKAYS